MRFTIGWMWRWMSSAAIVVAVSAPVLAQAGKDMDKPAMSDSMMKATYTGCVELVNHGGMFLLTHVVDGHQMMTPGALVLTGPANLKKHVGRKVTVMGSLSKGATGTLRSDLDTLTVGSLKVVAKACS